MSSLRAVRTVKPRILKDLPSAAHQFGSWHGCLLLEGLRGPLCLPNLLDERVVLTSAVGNLQLVVPGC